MTSPSPPSRRTGVYVAAVAAGVAVLVVVALVLAVTVWRNRGGAPPAQPSAGPSTTPAATASTPSAGQDAETKAMAAYTGFREAYIAAAATADARTADLAKYVGDPLLLETRLALQTQGGQGIVYQGRPTWSARATAVNVSTRPFSVTIEDCLDTTNWTPVYKATGKPAAAGGQALRYVVTSTAQLYDDGRWLINQSKADRSRSC